ncbi:MAG: PQQ-dependent sugar dehydrogenase [Rhodanobacteraceae bacterium]|jgi:glucose/arabinose dehydrogenase|nr:PQQ-dependent sugar dehydrogenase [Rhodanobacteraceae bacterium]
MRTSNRFGFLFGFGVLLAASPLLYAPGAIGAPAAVVLTPVASGLSGPTAVTAAGDGSGRLFVIENLSGSGRIRIIDAAGNLLPTPYYTHATSGGPGSEQGMLGLAFDPDFASNGTLYVTYTAPAGDPRLGAVADQVLLRLVASDPSADTFAGSETEVLRIPDIYTNHNGGNIAFGPDSHLYWGMGDGGSGGDPNDFAQDLWKKVVGGKSYYLLGKMLRLDVRTPVAAAPANQCGASAGQPAQYAIPADNPFAGAADQCGEIWLYGLRNPWRWSFDRATGDLVIGDVGQGTYEEIDFRAAGSAGNRNYGWRQCEGNHHYNPGGSDTACPALTGTVAPVIEYPHASGACSVTGGYVYRGPAAELRGKYLFSDYCDGRIRVADVDAQATTWTYTLLAGTPAMNVFSFGEDAVGNVYVIDGGGGRVYRIDGPGVADLIFEDGFDGRP